MPALPTPCSYSNDAFLPPDIWAEYRKRPVRWPWLVLALVMGSLLALLITEWWGNAIFRPRTPRQFETTVALAAGNDSTEPGSILQVDRTGIVPRLPGAAPDSSSILLTSSVSETPSQPTDSSLVRLPPLSLLRIQFTRVYREPPVIKLQSETIQPGDISIDEVTTRYVVIRNTHATNDCSFRYLAEAKTEETSKP